MKQLFRASLIGLAVTMSACMEPQPAPDITTKHMDGFNIQVVADSLKNAWSVAPLGNNAYLVTERAGKLLYLSGGQSAEIKGLPDDIYVEGQAGLFDVILAPDYDTSSRLYISYAYGSADRNGTALMSATLSDGQLNNTKTLFRANPTKDTNAHFGGRIAFLADGTLVLSTGEGFQYREASQDLNSHLGKIIRLTADGGVPADNPGLGDKPQIYSYGHRNPQGLTFDAKTNTLWSHEHGPRGGDELNKIEAGKNYGWPIASHGIDYNGAKITPHKTYPGMEDAVQVWVPSIAASGLAIYRGKMFPDWDGDALVGGLVSKDVRRINLENGEVVEEVSVLSDLNARVRDVRVDRDGALLVLTDADSGQLLRVTPK